MIDILEQARAMHALFSQDGVWFDAQCRRHDVAEMSVRYKANVVAFLERRAPNLELLYSFGEIQSVSLAPTDGSMAADMLEQALDEETARRAADPVAWLHSTPLVARMLRDVEAGLGGEDN
jgi:hypothetical protein